MGKCALIIIKLEAMNKTARRLLKHQHIGPELGWWHWEKKEGHERYSQLGTDKA